MPEIGRRLFNEDTVRRRLTGHAEYIVGLSDDVRNALVTRDFMTTTYGGSAREFYPKIDPDKRRLLGHDHHFLFPNLLHNPHAPQHPGQPGLLCRSADEAPWGDRAMKVLVRIGGNMWRYMGEYQTVKTEPLSREEFSGLAATVRTTSFWRSIVEELTRLGLD